MDEQSHYRWVAMHILPLEVQARRWLSRHVRSLSRQDVDDLIQEAYSRIWTADAESIARPRAYLFTTLRNLILEQARHAQIVPMERMGEIDELRIPSDEPGPERRVAARQELERVGRLMIALPAQCRRVFELRKMDGLSQRQVATEMGISERTVEKHLAKALSRMLDGIAGDEARRPNEDTFDTADHGRHTKRD